MRLELPWPPRELHPNARVHFMRRAAAAKACREQAYWLAREAYNLSPVRVKDRDAILVSLTFHPPDKRRRDLDGMLTSSKNQLDGIADALGINDQLFEFNLKRAEPIKGGKILVEIL